jgi:hypothetical protein
VPDTDTDGDGVADCNDECKYEPNKTNPGQCGCDTPDTDSDGDGTPDCLESDDAEDLEGASVYNARRLRPVRITSRAWDWDDDTVGNTMLFEVDRRGSVHIVTDFGGGPEREAWWVIDGVVYAGEGSIEGLQPGQVIYDPEDWAGFDDPWDVFSEHSMSYRFYYSFPLHILLGGGYIESAERMGSDRIHGISADRYRVQIDIGAAVLDQSFPDILLMDERSQSYDLWVEPSNQAIVRAEWDATHQSDRVLRHSFEVEPFETRDFAPPESEAPEEGRPPAGDAIVYYYDLIDGGEYEAAWSLLSPRFQNERLEGDFDVFRDYWVDLDPCGVWLENVRLRSQSGDAAKVSVELVYDLCGGDVRRYDIDYYLVYDDDWEEWLIDSSERK